MTMTMVGEDGDEAPVKVSVTRKGSTVVTFTVLNLASRRHRARTSRSRTEISRRAARRSSG